MPAAPAALAVAVCVVAARGAVLGLALVAADRAEVPVTQLGPAFPAAVVIKSRGNVSCA